MSKITIQLGFYFENQHYAQVQAFIPRQKAVKIPGLKVEEFQFMNPKKQQNQAKSSSQKNKKGSSKMSKSEKSQSKKDESEEDNQNQQDFQNQQNEMDVEDQGEGAMDEIQVELEEQIQQDKLMKYLEDDESEEDDDDMDDDDLSSISKSLSVIRSNHKTKRQKGQKKDLMELPDRRPRKDKNFDEANQILRREEKQIKRKQYLKKQTEANQKATLDKILNETGKKLKMREQKQNIYIMERQHKVFKTLGDVPKFIVKSTQQGDELMIHGTEVFDQKMLRTPQIKMKQPCTKCGTEVGKYKMKTTNGIKFACSLNCYKMIC